MPRQSVNAFITVHLILSCFFLPAAVLYLITGACYTMGYTGSYITTVHMLPLDAPLQADLDACRALAKGLLETEGIIPPSGGEKIRRVGTSFVYEWTGSNRDVLLSPTENPAQVRLEVKNTTLFRRMVQLHKAKGGVLFKGYAVAFSAALMVSLISGAVIAWLRPSLRKLSIAAACSGLIALALFILWS